MNRPVDAESTITAQTVSLSTDKTVESDGRRLPWNYFVIAGAIALLTFWMMWLPSTDSAPPTVAAPPTSNAPESAADELTDNEREQRRAAQDVLDDYLRKRQDLSQVNADIWAADRMAKMQQLITDGQLLFAERHYAQALASYQRANELREGVQTQGRQDFDEAVAATRTALSNGDAMRARNTVERALQIQPTDSTAQQLQQRALTMPDVLKLVAAAESAIAAADFMAAEAALTRAEEMDAEYEPVTRAMARLGAGEQEQDYLGVMNQGYEAMDGGDYEAARAAFERARSIAPARDDVQLALKQLQEAKTRADMTRFEVQGAALAQQEQWNEAATIYKTALKVDGSLRYAQEGLRLASARARLFDDIDAVLTKPESLSDDAALGRAEALHKQALAATADESKLRARAERLGATLSSARALVPVVLASDGKTDVRIARGPALGLFSDKELTLRPGAYTLIGVRQGYRDVRQTMIVSREMGPVQIRCEEPI